MASGSNHISSNDNLYLLDSLEDIPKTMNYQERKQKLVNEFNELEVRQREIMGAIKVLEEMEKEEKPIKEEKK